MGEAGLSELAGVVGAAGAALALLAGRRSPLLAGFALVAAGLAGLVVLAVGAAVFVRYPALVVPAVLVAAPFRLPFDFDRDHRFFFALAQGGKLGRLVPLYVVLAAAVTAYLWRVLRRTEVAPIPRLIALPAAAFFALASLSLIWSRDLDAGSNLLVFFLLPFAALVAVVARAELAPWLPKALAWISLGLASLFAAVGLWQELTEDLFFYSPQLEVANAYSPFFRVTSLFTDPSLYGRHVVLGFAVLLVLLWAGKIGVVIAAPLMVLLFAGLYFSYSQSSMAALFVVTAAVTIVAGDRLARRAVLVATAVAVLVAAGFVGVQARDQSIRALTSGRWQRAELTIDVAREQPLIGVGLGAQPKVSRELGAGRSAREARFVSHTTPLTVAAELGLVGFALYVVLLLAAIRMLALLRETLPTLALALGAVLLALFTHSLAYSGFFEDPITWLTLGVGAAYLAVRAPAREPEPAPADSGTIASPQPVPSK